MQTVKVVVLVVVVSAAAEYELCMNMHGCVDEYAILCIHVIFVHCVEFCDNYILLLC